MKKTILRTSLVTAILFFAIGVNSNAMPTDVYGGETRVHVALSTASKVNSENLVIVSANAFADALSANNIVSKSGGKIILVYDDTDLSDFLNSQKPNKITLIGGPLSLKGKPVEQAYQYCSNVERIEGENRYVVNENTLNIGGFSKIAIADGRNFSDALSASGFLAREDLGLKLVDGSKEYSLNGREAVYTFGGPLSVKYAKGNRVGGANRYEASININKLLGNPDKVAVSVGNVFSDAISSINMVTANKDKKVATLIVDKNQNKFTYAQRDYVFKAKSADVIGGLVSQGIIDELRAMPMTVTGQTIPDPIPGKFWIPETNTFEDIIPNKPSKDAYDKSKFEYWDRINKYSRAEIMTQSEIQDWNKINLAREKTFNNTILTNNDKPAVMIKREVMRNKPAFPRNSTENWSTAETAIQIWEPLKIKYYSSDTKWAYVETINYKGWLPTNSFVRTDLNTIKQYINKPFGVIISRQYAGNSVKIDMGTKLPMNGSKVLLPYMNSSGKLSVREIFIDSTNLNIGYLKYSQDNIVKQAIKFQGEPYGWGGIMDAHDCSSLVQDTYKSFGIILPRNAGSQEVASFGRKTNLTTISNKSLIAQKLSPGNTIYMKGHVVLYIGKDESGVPSIMHQFAGYYSGQRYIDVHAGKITKYNLQRDAYGNTYLSSYRTSVNWIR